VLPVPKKLEKSLKRRLSTTPPVNGTPAKRTKLNGASPMKSPSKKQRLEMEGLIIMEKEDDVIVIDD
jgi:hypothetical protein